MHISNSQKSWLQITETDLDCMKQKTHCMDSMLVVQGSNVGARHAEGWTGGCRDRSDSYSLPHTRGPGWPQNHYVAEGDGDLPPASTSQVSELQVCITRTNLHNTRDGPSKVSSMLGKYFTTWDRISAKFFHFCGPECHHLPVGTLSCY